MATRITIVWLDRDGTRTIHEFDDRAAAEAWLRSVLSDWCPVEELEAGGYTPDGVGMLHLYADEGYDDVGSLELFIDGLGVTPDALHE